MIDLDPPSLMREAERTSGLTDWGGLSFINGLDAFCAALEEDGEICAPARENIRTEISNLLGKRLTLYRDRARYPEIPAQRITRPLIITGLPRSGSTLLHGMLAQDPRARGALTWELDEISPPARASTYLNDPRIARTQARLDRFPQEFHRIHPMGATLPDECNFITALAFQSVNLYSRFYSSSYVDWYLQADDAPAFEVHKHMLQHMQAFCPRDWWVLKSPPHIFHLPRIFETYPDARVIFLHRDPAATVPSITNLFAFSMRHTYGDAFDPHRVGRGTLSWWRAGMDRALTFRSGQAHAHQIFDLHYQAFVKAPMDTIAALYDWLGIELNAGASQAMRRFLRQYPKESYGPRTYTAETYGLSPIGIRKVFADYIERFAIAVG